MIPLIIAIGRKQKKLYLPLLLLYPILILLSPIFLLAFIGLLFIYQQEAVRSINALWQIIIALPGLTIDLSGNNNFYLSIY